MLPAVYAGDKQTRYTVWLVLFAQMEELLSFSIYVCSVTTSATLSDAI